MKENTSRRRSLIGYCSKIKCCVAKGQLVLQENNSDLKTAGSSFSPEGVAPRDPGGKASPLLTASMGPASWRDCCGLSLPGLHQEMHVTPTLPRGLA